MGRRYPCLRMNNTASFAAFCLLSAWRAAQPFPIGSGFPEPLEETHKRIRGVYNGTLPLDIKRLIEDIRLLKSES